MSDTKASLTDEQRKQIVKRIYAAIEAFSGGKHTQDDMVGIAVKYEREAYNSAGSRREYLQKVSSRIKTIQETFGTPASNTKNDRQLNGSRGGMRARKMGRQAAVDLKSAAALATAQAQDDATSTGNNIGDGAGGDNGRPPDGGGINPHPPRPLATSAPSSVMSNLSRSVPGRPTAALKPSPAPVPVQQTSTPKVVAIKEFEARPPAASGASTSTITPSLAPLAQKNNSGPLSSHPRPARPPLSVKPKPKPRPAGAGPRRAGGATAPSSPRRHANSPTTPRGGRGGAQLNKTNSMSSGGLRAARNSGTNSNGSPSTASPTPSGTTPPMKRTDSWDRTSPSLVPRRANPFSDPRMLGSASARNVRASPQRVSRKMARSQSSRELPKSILKRPSASFRVLEPDQWDDDGSRRRVKFIEGDRQAPRHSGRVPGGPGGVDSPSPARRGPPRRHAGGTGGSKRGGRRGRSPGRKQSGSRRSKSPGKMLRRGGRSKSRERAKRGPRGPMDSPPPPSLAERWKAVEEEVSPLASKALSKFKMGSRKFNNWAKVDHHRTTIMPIASAVEPDESEEVYSASAGSVPTTRNADSSMRSLSSSADNHRQGAPSSPSSPPSTSADGRSGSTAGAIMISGYLEKKGKTRWFVLHKGFLSWYNREINPGVIRRGDARPNGAIDITSQCWVHLVPAKPKSTLEISTAHDMYKLHSPSEEVLHNWLLAMVAAGCREGINPNPVKHKKHKTMGIKTGTLRKKAAQARDVIADLSIKDDKYTTIT